MGKITLTGTVCYSFRNGMLHQGRSNHKEQGFSRVPFTEPSSPIGIHNGVIIDVLCLDLERFCSEVITGVEDWLAHVQDNEFFKNNYKHYMKRHPDRIAPVGKGFPMIG